jgi:hypothetical protein
MTKRYPEGIRFFQKHKNAPDFVLASVSIDPKKLIQWLQGEEPNEKGYIRLDLLQGKEAPYLTVNEYVSKKFETSKSDDIQLDNVF